MRTTEIPAEAVWPGGRAAIIGPPPEHPGLPAVPAVVDYPDSMPGHARISVRCELEAGDLAKLAGGGHVWVSFYGMMVPFCVDVTGPDGR